MKQQLNKKNFDYDFFRISMERAIDVISEIKKENSNFKFRMETKVNKENITVYVIEKSKICKIIDVCGADVVVRDI